jgi:hypothetical protein
MAQMTIGKRLMSCLALLLLSPILVPIMVLQAFGFLKGQPFSWETFADDRDDPLRRWARCVICITASDASNRSDSPDESRRGLSQGWNIANRAHFDAMFDGLSGGRHEDEGWDLGRLVGVIRMAWRAGLIDEMEYRRLTGVVIDRLKSRFQSWDDLAQSMLEGLERQSREDPQSWQGLAKSFMHENIGKLRQTLWQDTPWDLSVASERED